VPIPTPGIQLVTLTHVEDVASMLAAVPGNKAAVGQHYNICSDRAITFQGARPLSLGVGVRRQFWQGVCRLIRQSASHFSASSNPLKTSTNMYTPHPPTHPPHHQGIVKAVAKALGKDPKVVLYSPEAVGTGKGGKAEGFPFRTVHFFASADKAKRELGWRPAHDFLADADALVAAYKASGRESKELDFAIDDKILAAVGAA